MKLKYNFVTRNVAGQSIAIAVGEDNAKFNGMIKLNSVGEFIFKLLENDISYDEIISKITDEYEVTADDASKSVDSYLTTLRNNSLLDE